MNDTHYFNLYTSGLGYLNRIREVTPKKGELFLCCDIAALRAKPATRSTLVRLPRQRQGSAETGAPLY